MDLVVKNLRKTFNTHVTKSLSWRKYNLNQLLKLIEENSEELCASLKKDLNKNPQETFTMELGVIKSGIIHSLNNLDDWVKPQKTLPPFAARALLGTCIEYQPYGVVLILGAWNYPLQVSLVPLVGAIASGNCAIVKPSELSMHSSLLLEKLWPKYFDSNQIALINGGVKETQDLLKQRFDYIFYTGSTAIAKIIMEAAAKNLTPVTLECGGKSPVYIDGSADLDITAKRLIWGRFVNTGQTCVAPDYVLTTKEIQEKLKPLMEKYLTEFYGTNPKESDSYGRIINDRHFQRVLNLIDKSKVVIGGESDAKEKYISPTVMFNVTKEDKVMHEEIFGPVLPFVTVSNHEEAIDFINDGDKPLAMYVFGKNDKIYDELRHKTSSGSIVYNEVLMQAGLECLPFGGVGASGIGKYHGKHSFECFSHPRAVLNTSFFGDFLMAFRYPPYSKSKTKQASMVIGEFRKNAFTSFITNPYFLFSMVIALAIYLKSKLNII